MNLANVTVPLNIQEGNHKWNQKDQEVKTLTKAIAVVKSAKTKEQYDQAVTICKSLTETIGNPEVQRNVEEFISVTKAPEEARSEKIVDALAVGGTVVKSVEGEDLTKCKKKKTKKEKKLFDTEEL